MQTLMCTRCLVHLRLHNMEYIQWRSKICIYPAICSRRALPIFRKQLNIKQTLILAAEIRRPKCCAQIILHKSNRHKMTICTILVCWRMCTRFKRNVLMCSNFVGTSSPNVLSFISAAAGIEHIYYIAGIYGYSTVHMSHTTALDSIRARMCAVGTTYTYIQRKTYRLHLLFGLF